MSSLTQITNKKDKIINNVERLIRKYDEEVVILNNIQRHICSDGCDVIVDVRNYLNNVKMNKISNVNLNNVNLNKDVIEDILSLYGSILTNKFDFQIRQLVEPTMPIINAAPKSFFGESKNKQKAREDSFKTRKATYDKELADYNNKVNNIKKAQETFISILENHIKDLIDTYTTQNKIKKDLIGPYSTNSNSKIVNDMYNDIVKRINGKQPLSTVRDDILQKYQSSLNTFIYGGKRHTKKRRSSSIKRKHRNRSSRVRK